mmetsp:Transcript_9565/g.17381  ORF Transcript_9565/g.17381 Transcript_9565/m.17381 type:complete len:185 (+) Transcript_9565:72-626(+)
MKIVKAESLFLFLTVLLVGQATAQFTFVQLDEEENEGRNLKRNGSDWGTFGYAECMEPVRRKLGSRLRLSNCTGTDLPTRNQQFRFRKESTDDYYYYEGKLEWRGKRGKRKWCVDVRGSLKGGKPLVLARCGKRGITKWITDSDKTRPIDKQRLCIFPRANGTVGDLVIVTNCDKNGGSFDFGR